MQVGFSVLCEELPLSHSPSSDRWWYKDSCRSELLLLNVSITVLLLWETVCAGVLAVLGLQGAAFVNASSTEMGCEVGRGGEMCSRWALGMLRVLAIVPSWTPLNPRNLICKLGLAIPTAEGCWKDCVIYHTQGCTRTCIAAVSSTSGELPAGPHCRLYCQPVSLVSDRTSRCVDHWSFLGRNEGTGFSPGRGLWTLAQNDRCTYFPGVKNHV